jgi:hypothetical protein
MTSFLISDLLQDLKQITSEGANFLENEINQLSEVQKKWKPNAISWNIDEVCAHLNSYAAYYNKVMRFKISKTKFLAKRETFISSPLGKATWMSIKLGNVQNVKRKLKSPKMYNPSIEKVLVKGNDDLLFTKYQKELLTLLDDASKVSLRKVKIPIAIARLVRLRLGDALMFVIYHNERHLQQIKNIVNSPDFPKK